MDASESLDTAHKYIMAPIMSGLVGGAIFYYIYGNEGKLYIGPTSMPVSPVMAFGSSIMVGEVFGILATDAISQHNQVAQLDYMQKKVLRPLISATLAALSALVAFPAGTQAAGQLVALGSSSQIGGDYIHKIIMKSISIGLTLKYY